MAEPEYAPPEIVEPLRENLFPLPGALERPDGNSALVMSARFRLDKELLFDAYDLAAITDTDMRKMATVATWVMVDDIASGRLMAKDAKEAAGIAEKLSKIAQSFETDFESKAALDVTSRLTKLEELAETAKARKKK